MNTTITEQQVKEWALARLAEIIAIMPSGAHSFNIQADDFDRMNGPRVCFTAYQDKVGHGKSTESLDASMQSFKTVCGLYSPQEVIEKKRLEAVIKSKGIPRDDVKAHVKATYGHEHFADLNKQEYKDLDAAIETWPTAEEI